MPISIIRIQRALRDCPKAGHNEAARTLIGTIPKIKEFHLLEAEFRKSSVYRSGVVRESQYLLSSVKPSAEVALTKAFKFPSSDNP